MKLTPELLEYKNHIKQYSIDDLQSIYNSIDRSRFPEKFRIISERIQELGKSRDAFVAVHPDLVDRTPWKFVLRCWWWNAWRKLFASIVASMMMLLIFFLVIIVMQYGQKNTGAAGKPFAMVILVILSIILLFLIFYIDYFVFSHFLKATVGNYEITITDKLDNTRLIEPVPQIAFKFWWWRTWRLYLVYIIFVISVSLIVAQISSASLVFGKHSASPIKSLYSVAFTLLDIYLYHRLIHAQIGPYHIRLIPKGGYVPEEASAELSEPVE